MSTTHTLFTEAQLIDFSQGLQDWPNTSWDIASYEIGVSPFTTIYFLYRPEEHLKASLLLVDIHEAFEALVGKPYVLGTHPDSERPHPYYSKRLPDRREYARKTPLHKQFVFNVTDESNSLSSPATAGYYWRSSTWDGLNNNSYSRIQLYYRWQWWLDNQSAWRQFVLETIDRLQARLVYSGFAMANPLDLGARSEVAVWERSLAPRFYGLDIDFPFGMALGLMRGIRPPTWAFLLSNDWRDKLGLQRADVRARLAHPRIAITELDSGQWIELGDKPELYPVERGVPELPALLNKLLRPIRNDDLGLVGFGQWDGDPNERFDRNDSRRWLGRFDQDSDWPSAELRDGPAPDGPGTGLPLLQRVEAGRPCPRSGWWFTPARIDSRRHFEQGELMPAFSSDYGLTVWHWEVDQVMLRRQ